MFPDIFNDDAFSLVSLTAAINNVDHVPGRAGELAFAGVGEGVNTTTVAIERRGTSLSLIKTSARSTPAEKEAVPVKSSLRSVDIPHIKLEDTIGAQSVQGVRAFGSPNELLGVQTVVQQQMNKMAQRHDLTLEFHRLGALKGQILDADASVLTDLFQLFDVKNSANAAAPEEFDMDLEGIGSEEVDLRVKAQEVRRYMLRAAKMVVPSSALVWAFCGDEFFDKLISKEDVKRTFIMTDEQRVRLGANYAFGLSSTAESCGRTIAARTTTARSALRRTKLARSLPACPASMRNISLRPTSWRRSTPLAFPVTPRSRRTRSSTASLNCTRNRIRCLCVSGRKRWSS